MQLQGLYNMPNVVFSSMERMLVVAISGCTSQNVLDLVKLKPLLHLGLVTT